MSRLFYAWEFGANLGHIAAFLPFGRALRDKGYTLDWAVTQTGPAARLLQREGFGWLQAPVMPEVRREGPPLSYADILLRFGYADAEDLLGLVVAWRELLKLTGTRLVLADHAPTAVLAAQTLDIPVMLFSNGFTVPPRMRPLPNMRPWNDVPVETLLALEDVALASVNKVLTGFGKSRLDALWQIFAVAEETMITYPELDHYDNRGPARYWGSLPNASIGIAPPWPAVSGRRIFAYLRPETPHCEAMVAALHAAGQPTVIYLPGASDAFKSKWQAPHLIFSPQPADLGLVAQDVDMAVTYSSLATTTAFLFAGKPLLLLPSHLEQFLLAKRVTELGAGVLVNPEQADVDLLAALRSVLSTPALTENAQAFAAKYAAFPQEQVLGNLVRRVEELCPLTLSEKASKETHP
jgi:UDP:flavonoid glycosyltransferase YjiC (YdhE family)